MEHHACANLEHLFLYSSRFSANAQGAPGNYRRLLEKHGRELVWTLIGIVQTIGSGNGTLLGIAASTLDHFYSTIIVVRFCRSGPLLQWDESL